MCGCGCKEPILLPLIDLNLETFEIQGHCYNTTLSLLGLECTQASVFHKHSKGNPHIIHN